MFEDELKDLELTYKATLVNINKEIEFSLPTLLYCMEDFVKLHKQNKVVRERLDRLLAKVNGEKNVEEDDEEYDDD
ncbi:MAG: hypothetical protein ACH349_01570 [Candidatus Rhabdochlamydia sp.]